MSYIHKHQVLLQDTDAFGVVYFARFFDFASAAFECYLANSKLGLQSMSKHAAYLAPVSAADCKYVRPVMLGDQIDIKIRLQAADEYSIKSTSELYNQSGTLVAIVSITNTFVSKADWKKIEIPSEYKALT